MKSLSSLIICMFFAVLPVVFTACADEWLVEPAGKTAETTEQQGDGTGVIPLGTRSLPDGYEEAVIVYNPYSLENVLKMLEQMQEEGMTRSGLGGFDPGGGATGGGGYNIAPTHYHVRFRPQTDEQYYLIKDHASINVRVYPFDVYAPAGTMSYQDNDWSEGQYPFLFAVVPINFQFPNIPYDILEELVDFESLGLPDPYDNSGSSAITDPVTGPGGGNGSGRSRGTFVVSPGASGGGGSSTETEGVHKTGDMKGYPEGTIRVWDDLLKRYVPLKGVKVNMWRNMFFTQTEITDENGHFKSHHKFGGKVDYEVVWETSGYDIRHDNLGQAVFKMSGETDQKLKYNIGSATSDSENYRRAAVHRAAYRYFFGNVGGLMQAMKHMNGGSKLKIAYHHTTGTNIYNPVFSAGLFGTFPDIKIYKESENFQVIRNTFHEMGHYVHCERGHNGDFVLTSPPIQESWAAYVEWHLMQVEYTEICNKMGLTTEEREEILEDDIRMAWDSRRFWPYGGTHSADFSNSINYTPLLIDLVDDFNQQLSHDRSSAKGKDNVYPNDDVTGYSAATLNSITFQITTLAGLKSKLKANKPAGVTDAQINTLFTRYEQVL